MKVESSRIRLTYPLTYVFVNGCGTDVMNGLVSSDERVQPKSSSYLVAETWGFCFGLDFVEEAFGFEASG